MDRRLLDFSITYSSDASDFCFSSDKIIYSYRWSLGLAGVVARRTVVVFFEASGKVG